MTSEPKIEQTELIAVPNDHPRWQQRRQSGIGALQLVAADWAYWRQHDRVELARAVLLSLNVDPRPVGYYMDDQYDEIEIASMILDDIDTPNRHRIWVRLEVARSHLGQDLPQAGESNGKPAVRLQDFAAWARAVGWELPPELEQRAAVVPPTTNAEGRLMKAAVTAQAHFGRLRAKGKGWPTVDEGVDWLIRKKVVSTKPEGEAVMKVIRPDDLPRGPRSGRDDDE